MLLETLIAEVPQPWSFISMLSSANTQNRFSSALTPPPFFLAKTELCFPEQLYTLISPLFPLFSIHNSSRFSRSLRVLADIWLWQLLDHWLAWLFIHCISKGCLKLRPGSLSPNIFLWIVFARLQYPAQIPLSFQPVYFRLLLTEENPPDVEATSSKHISSFLKAQCSKKADSTRNGTD